jgi:hypothetical protein
MRSMRWQEKHVEAKRSHLRHRAEQHRHDRGAGRQPSLILTSKAVTGRARRPISGRVALIAIPYRATPRSRGPPNWPAPPHAVDRETARIAAREALRVAYESGGRRPATYRSWGPRGAILQDGLYLEHKPSERRMLVLVEKKCCIGRDRRGSIGRQAPRPARQQPYSATPGKSTN